MQPLAVLKEKFKNLYHSQATPAEIALGIAIGVFIGVLPLYGFHLLLWLLAAFLVPQANKLAIFVGTNISLPATIPLITWTAYEIGRRTLGGEQYPPFNFMFFENIDLKNISSYYYPLFIGSIILGLVCACIFYAVSYTVVDLKQKRKRKMDAARAQEIKY
jgi:uncharacterized protein (TIGR03546 family)